MDAAAPVLVLGAGSWGTALALVLARNGNSVRLWDISREHMRKLAGEGENKQHLPGMPFPAGIVPELDLERALADVDDLILAVPVNALRSLLQSLQSLGRNRFRTTWACKGFETGSGKLVHEVVEEVLGPQQPYAVLSGPSFAAEVARGLPSALVLAATHAELADDLMKRFHSRHFRIYAAEDIRGIEVAGALKNVMAIATGISDGLGFGANTRAALITRGLAELTRFGVELGARVETFMGLAGLGDLVLTCSDDQSRNRRFGLALAAGHSPEQALEHIGQAVEGVPTALVVDQRASTLGVEMPISAQVARLIRGECAPRDAVEALLARSPKQEGE